RPPSRALSRTARTESRGPASRPAVAWQCRKQDTSLGEAWLYFLLARSPVKRVRRASLTRVRDMQRKVRRSMRYTETRRQCGAVRLSEASGCMTINFERTFRPRRNESAIMHHLTIAERLWRAAIFTPAASIERGFWYFALAGGAWLLLHVLLARW